MTKIQWTDETWNPVTGCTKVSEGCRHCYAEALAPRVFAGQVVCHGAGGEAYFDSVDDARDATGVFNEWAPRTFTDVRCHPERLDKPLRWRKPRMVFVNSMSDLFHEVVPDGFIIEVFAVMEEAAEHTFQVLTKRPSRMRDWCRKHLRGSLRNVWLGVSCEDQETADERIPILLDTPAAVRFVSCEPLLGPIDIGSATLGAGHDAASWSLDWCIVGGESGPKARPCDVAWICSIVAQCKAAGVPVFVKQDSGRWPGKQGRIPEDMWIKEWPERVPS